MMNKFASVSPNMQEYMINFNFLYLPTHLHEQPTTHPPTYPPAVCLPTYLPIFLPTHLPRKVGRRCGKFWIGLLSCGAWVGGCLAGWMDGLFVCNQPLLPIFPGNLGNNAQRVQYSFDKLIVTTVPLSGPPLELLERAGGRRRGLRS